MPTFPTPIPKDALTEEQKKKQSHTLNRSAFNASPDVLKRVKDKPAPAPAKEQTVKELWESMSEHERTDALKDMDPLLVEQLSNEVGLYKYHPEATVRAQPSLLTLEGIKQRANTLLIKGAQYLPTAGGLVGGYGAGLATAEVGPEVAIPAKAGGSAFGGGIGEAERQLIEHVTGYEAPDYTWGQRAKDVAIRAGEQGAAEIIAGKLSSVMRPTFETSIDKIVSIGALSGSSKLGAVETKSLENVMQDLINTEKAGNKVVTIGDFSNLLETAKREIGNKVDLAMQQPVMRNGKQIPLRDAEANTNPIANRIKNLLTAHPSEAPGAVGDNPTKLTNIRKRAMQYAKPRTYGELTDRRIVLNNELSGFYNLPASEQRAYLLQHPEIEIDKAEADAIRDIIYPEMDIASGHEIGTTKALQEKRGALITLSKAFDKRLGIPAQLHAKSREIAGTPFWKRGNISTYGTTSGRPGMAVHRLGSLMVKPDPEREASTQVARAFGNKTSTKVAKALTTPFGSKELGTQVMSLPLRALVIPSAPAEKEQDDATPENQQKDTPQGTTGPQSSIPSNPKDMMAKANELQDMFHSSGFSLQPSQPTSSEGETGPQSSLKITHRFNPKSGLIEAA
jgi:hypothetical protein